MPRRLLLLLLLLPILGRSQSPSIALPAQVSLCDIKANPADFVHKYVELTVTASHGFEDSMVEDSKCLWGKDHPGVWMEYGGTRSTDTMYCCGLSPSNKRPNALAIDGISLPLVEDDNFREFDRRLHPNHRPRRESDAVQATLRGYIFAKYEGIGGTQVSPRWEGYGHMGCCILFVVEQVIAVDPKEVKREWAPIAPVK